jgi:hypothetical protein
MGAGGRGQALIESSDAARALLAGILQGIGIGHGDEQLLDAGLRLEASIGCPTAPDPGGRLCQAPRRVKGGRFSS